MLSIEKIPSSDPHEISSIGVDLSFSSTGDDHNSLPNFSIRDYVFNTRSKDIKTNWPFSEKSLELCLKHGVSEILPPFQSSERTCVESGLGEKGKIINSNEEPSNIVANTNLGEFLWPKSSEKMESYSPKKPAISMKKSKLVVKIGPSGIEPSSNLKVASKVCPICKIFSSSSNTKLNAHIDQCLSMDSPIEPISKSRAIKHGIKPRKIRSIVDIYTSAKYCTVEELDRRNGRIWSEKPSLPTILEDSKVDYREENKSIVLDKEGVVYIDSNGTKIRILNEVSDMALGSKLGVNPHRLGKGSKKNSIFKKKKKNSKCLKISSSREKTCSYKTRLASRILGDKEKDKFVEEIAKKNENMDVNIVQISSKSREHITNSETIVTKGASSKRTDPLKRRLQGDTSSLRDLDVERSYPQKVRNCHEIPHLSSQNSNANSSCEDLIGEYHEPAPMKKLKSFWSHSADMDETLSSSRKEMLLIEKSSSSEPKSSKISPLRTKNCQHSIDEDPSQVPIKKSTILKIKKKRSPYTTHFKDGYLNDESFLGGKFVIGQSFDQDFYSIGDTDTDVQENYFLGIDPITIPGPPGSFLPSPGRTSSDEDHQINSSLTTIRVQSSLDQFEIANRDSSNSPKSLNSTLSNSLISRSDSKLIENLSLKPLVSLSDEITENTRGYCPHKEGISVNDHGFGSPSRSSPNPVLRLMGKNLTVYNNDENLNHSLFSPLGYNKIERVETLSGTNIIQKNEEFSNDYYNSSRLNPFYSYQGSDFSSYRGSYMIPNASLSMAPPSSSLVMRWNSSVLEGSRMLTQNPLSDLPSTNLVRSSLFTSPSMP